MPRKVAGGLHEKVRQKILQRVITNEYKAGERLPSTTALASEFGVSVITIGRALRDLKTIGIVRTVPGLGAFVRDMRRFIGDLDFSFTSLGSAQKHGLKLSIHLTSVTRERIQHSVFNDFDTPIGTMHCIRKIISVDGTPIMFNTLFLPLSLDGKIIDELGDTFASKALRDHGIRFRKTRLLIDAAPASEEAQQAFGIPNGYPTLRRFCHLTTADISFSVFGIAESPFDRLACTATLQAFANEKEAERHFY
ncbi:MAG: GntR family transcriptional regulator [Mesorhizobium sp.]|uniref:GntR family transcriptional regulator n=1 Tax=unclassified Mesorhizobium TaxID=325217 RepID=UPI000FCB8688|nr:MULTISPECIES: GntR family transcriptional regulator [unclassified Mesorhizobium]MCT2581263.1 GntR family transcriptional regulator [Mesorhizobium sp. P13.3]MDF3170342.1 GntR family transcriptional regulator [Mesorhizobium sp. P16.1]MDF3181452.1 GntR family transcriptional regulator [Mesorhizobium sp. P17.1]MDF3187176.1 GntR family transcriptional regulator [Mesorhizobium sp. ICCV3110.1]RUV56948.1 GntR family transcriptional regulator [Mesorhizobium sp. M1A.F.Ca.IN.022.02.1.1]